MKFKLFGVLAFMLVFMLVLSVTASAATNIYNVNKDKNSVGADIVDIRDLVASKKSSAYNSEFLITLRRILLGLQELPNITDGEEQENNNQNNNSSGAGDIYLPEVP